MLLAPLGVLAPSLYSSRRTLRSLLALAFSVAVTIEALQLAELLVGVAHFRGVDIDDVILNVLGAAIGFGVWLALRALTSKCFQSTHARATPN
ncbi:MAG: VanZ family protein [Actinomycetia bacterium]|nr:VanZ family protein [Actinomycetes bacterium]